MLENLTTGALTMADIPFKILLYRYFFFSWLFKDICKGNLYERSGAWRYNKEQAKWLPTYLKRWVVIGIMMYGLGALCEVFLHSQTLSAFFFVPVAISVSINSVIGALILGFKALSGPL